MLLTAFASGARAGAILDVTYTFEVTSTFGRFPAPVSVSGHIRFDQEAVDRVGSDADFGNYDLLSHDVMFGSTALVGDDSALQIHDDRFPDGGALVDAYIMSSSFDLETSGISILAIGFHLVGPADTFSGDDPFVPDPTDFTLVSVGAVAFRNLADGRNYGIFTPLSSVAFSLVPEPGSLTLLALGLLWVASRGTSSGGTHGRFRGRNERKPSGSRRSRR